MLRRTFMSALGVAIASPALADTWPNRQIKVIVPYPPGGPTDISARIVLEKAGHLLGQPVLFDNKGGASGMLGAEVAKNQPADGYTFLATTVAMLAITGHLQPIPVDPAKDFVTVARMSTSWMALAIHPSVPANTLAEFVAYVKANPGKVNFGSAGLGTITQLFGEMLNIEAGIKMTHVPYKGSAQATQDLLGGQIQAQFDQTVLPHILAGRLKGLAIINDSRWPQKPDIPTLREQGYGKEGGESWYGLLAPAGTPDPIVQAMAKAIEESVKSPDVIDKLDKGGAKPTYLSPADMRAQVERESRMFGDIIKRGNITLQ
ncbi:Tripartite-type tricarboxylate transporter, receptor component TctC [Enhydrobacter aerosaccus]|uniref:Tripartite-type tricarboxylate transporter, receptor component TctC n=1 Tax=Enhydrobacter aerosaccus TaxID=225324 RepID=A0A1T4RN91_9HYPH|nr:tripartite tricarboxylate transporter substrate binding protein [Enhydrobacter aerosaccus]SKA17347.1 Tripartite-type tricarboxylate transporter, receptor component TctC [Enhydrobacter aerosaccus]